MTEYQVVHNTSDKKLGAGSYSLTAGRYASEIYIGNLTPSIDNWNFTFAAWFKTADQGIYQTLWGVAYDPFGDDSGKSLAGLCLTSAGEIYSNFAKQVAGADPGLVMKSVINDIDNNQWQHVVIAVTHDTDGDAKLEPNDITVYLNGTSISLTTVTDGDDERLLATPPLPNRTIIGEWYDGWYSWGGFLDEVAFWNRTLTATEVAYLYNSGNGLAYPFDEAPVVESSRIYSQSNTTSDDLVGYCNASDDDDAHVIYYYEWHNNSVLHSSGQIGNWSTGTNYTEGVEINVANISNSTLTVGNWTLRCRADDSVRNSSWKNSTILEITHGGAGYENEGRIAIESGIQNALTSGYTVYTDQRVYVRLANGSQKLGRFDKVAVYGSQRWAFNYLTGSEAYTNLFNVTPLLYVWEETSLTNPEITSQVSALISGTKS
ncbi:LamG domain-containing protein [Candidatus Poribacteria bacterium]